MIAIVNIDKNPRTSGTHTYELRINREVITTFTHKREDSLAECLRAAAKAADLSKMKKIDQYLGMFNAS